MIECRLSFYKVLSSVLATCLVCIIYGQASILPFYTIKQKVFFFRIELGQFNNTQHKDLVFITDPKANDF